MDNSDEWLEVGARLREARDLVHYPQDTVSKLLNISRSSVSAMECGKRKVYALELRTLCRLYGVTPEYILGDPEQPPASTDGRCNPFCTRVLHQSG